MEFYRLLIDVSDHVIILENDSDMDGEQAIYIPDHQALVIAKDIKRLAQKIIDHEKEAHHVTAN